MTTTFINQLLEITRSLNLQLSAFHKAKHITFEHFTEINSKIDLVVGHTRETPLRCFLNIDQLRWYQDRSKNIFKRDENYADRVCMYLGSMHNKTKKFEERLEILTMLKKAS
jgi:hypothetical protein